MTEGLVVTFLAEHDAHARKVLAVFVLERQQHRLCLLRWMRLEMRRVIVALKAGACSSLSRHELRKRIARSQDARTQYQKSEAN
jgi:hypothetical protein